LQFHKRSQLFIGTHHETLSVAMRVNDADCLASLAHTDRARIVFDCRLANDAARMVIDAAST